MKELRKELERFYEYLTDKGRQCGKSTENIIDTYMSMYLSSQSIEEEGKKEEVFHCESLRKGYLICKQQCDACAMMEN